MTYTASHQSFFTYNLARPYPFRWFTPVVVSVFCVATVVFSLVNLAANGYVLVNLVSTNPNVTATHGTWFRKWPSFFVGNNRPKCQPAMISNMDTVFTNNTALTYTVAGITQSGTESVLDSLEYYNNVIEDCSVRSFDVDLQGVTVRSSKQFGFTQWGAVTRAYVACSVSGVQGKSILNMTTTYDYVLDRTSLTSVGTFLGTAFIQRNKTHSPNLWWGESLMSLHWNSVSGTMEAVQNVGTQSGDFILKGIISFTKAPEVDDIKDRGFFNIDYRFTVDNKDRTIGIIYPGGNDDITDIQRLHDGASNPDIWIQVDNLVKSMYSTILTDLGQTKASPNILKDQALLKYFLSDASDTLSMPVTYNSVPGPATRDDYTSDTSINILNTTINPSVISASYLCQIPKLKSIGNLLISIVIADLVFLNILWLIFKFIVDHFFLKDQDHNFFRIIAPSPAVGTDNMNLERATLLGGGGSAHNAYHYTSSPYMPQKTAIASSNSATTTPMASDLFESDGGGYALTPMGYSGGGGYGDDDMDIAAAAGRTQTQNKRSYRRPFQRRTSSSYGFLNKDANVNVNANTSLDRREFL